MGLSSSTSLRTQPSLLFFAGSFELSVGLRSSASLRLQPGLLFFAGSLN